MTTLSPSPLRRFEDVRAEIDHALGYGYGLTVDDAWAGLGAVARIGWLLCETKGYLGDSFHLWIQHYADRERADFDGPELLARVAWFGRDVDPAVADLLRWTAARGAAVRAGVRGEALFSAVVPVWSKSIAAGADWVRAVTERWPDGLDAADLPPAPPLVRRSLAGRPSLAYDDILEAVCVGGSHAVVELALRRYYDAGAGDDAIDEFYGEARTVDATSLLSWLGTSFDVLGADGRTEELDRALNPLLVALGLDAYPEDGFVRVPVSELEPLRERIDPISDFMRLDEPGADAPLTRRIRNAVMSDVGLFIGPESALDDDARAMMSQLALMGSIFVLGVES